MQQLTREQAIAFHESEAWRDMPAAQLAAFQLRQRLLCVPFEEFHRAVESVLGRPVWSHEFADPERLRDEMAGLVEPPTFDEILAMIPVGRLVVLGARSDEEG
ncbi:MAG: hypothetical protein WCK28_00180 [Burkholderiales bacterium]|jgi:hypothetical protein